MTKTPPIYDDQGKIIAAHSSRKRVTPCELINAGIDLAPGKTF